VIVIVEQMIAMLNAGVTVEMLLQLIKIEA